MDVVVEAAAAGDVPAIEALVREAYEPYVARIGEVRLYTHEKMTENLAYYPRRGFVETDRRTENGFSRVFFTRIVPPPATPLPPEARGLPATALGHPGPEREELNRLVMCGLKTSTTSLLREYEAEGEPLPITGRRYRLLDSDAESVAVIELTEVRIMRADEVDLEHAVNEGEGFTSVEEWRAAHAQVWPDLDDSTRVVLESFRVVHPQV